MESADRRIVPPDARPHGRYQHSPTNGRNHSETWCTNRDLGRETLYLEG
jgi:hypothetical protein